MPTLSGFLLLGEDLQQPRPPAGLPRHRPQIGRGKFGQSADWFFGIHTYLYSDDVRMVTGRDNRCTCE
jgi:hypothetical protein